MKGLVLSDERAEVDALLAALVAAESAAAAEALLDEAVALLRADGTRVAGRAAVVALFDAPGGDARYRVVGSTREGLAVALEVRGVPGRLALVFSGRARGGRLLEVSVRPG